MIELPPKLAQQFKQQLSKFEEEKRMPYVTSIERLAHDEGRQEELAAVWEDKAGSLREGDGA